MRKVSYIIIAVVLLLFTAGCVSGVPVIDLTEYGRVGFVDVSSSAEGEIARLASQQLIQKILEIDRDKITVIELGSEEEILRALGRERIDPETIQMIGKKYNVGVIVSGRLSISEVRPHIDISLIRESFGVKADVDASLMVKLLETEGGGTLWTDLVRDTKSVASVRIGSGGLFHFDAGTPEKAYGKLVRSLIRKISWNFMNG
ncbi:hypothetical protein LCGC14_1616960 [marine sediment metagenome]|uniref:Uncharacterized protein n=1 Tax=marine sediment metagenome TaxID=412755 RepID=A0A0F9I6M3_9ZZZZ